MKKNIFYSWQSDLSDNRKLIEDALKEAVKELKKEDILAVEPVVDRALKGAAGAVRIDHDILDRITQCAIFIGDVTLVTAPDHAGRPAPNPNVLLELGYAVAKHSWQRVILPFNESYGEKHELPFDLEKNRLLRFTLPTDCDRESTKKVLADLVIDFKKAIEAILGLPTLKDEIASFLDSTNPKILQRVREGAAEVSVMLASHRIPAFHALLGTEKAKEFVTYRPNGNINIGLRNSTLDCVNDVQEGNMQGFHLTFRGSW